MQRSAPRWESTGAFPARFASRSNTKTNNKQQTTRSSAGIHGAATTLRTWLLCSSHFSPGVGLASKRTIPRPPPRPPALHAGEDLRRGASGLPFLSFLPLAFVPSLPLLLLSRNSIRDKNNQSHGAANWDQALVLLLLVPGKQEGSRRECLPVWRVLAIHNCPGFLFLEYLGTS